MRQTRRFQLNLFLCSIFIAVSQVVASVVDEPLESALERAKISGKPCLVAFLGDEWSVASKRFQQNILSSKEFQALIEEKIIFYPVRGRVTPKPSKKERAILQSLVIYFDVHEYPTCIILNSEGIELFRHGYEDIEPDDYIESLGALLELSLEAKK